LWSIGIDINSPTAQQDVQRWFDGQPANVKAEIQKGMGPQPGRGSINPLVYAADWRQRDVARKIQKENGFFTTLPGKILGTAAQVGLGFVPGVGPALSAGFGAIQGGLTGGFKGAVLGGLGGYGAGKLGAGLSGAFSNAGGLSTFLKAPGTFASNLGRNALTSAQNFIPGYGGSISNVLGSAATSGAGLLSGASRGGSGVTTAAGGTQGMGWFEDALKQSLPNILGNAVGSGISYLGQQSASNDMQQAANTLAASQQFKPYNVSGPYGTASFSGNNATAGLSPEMQALYNQYKQTAGGAFSDYNKFNTGDFSQNYYDTIKRYKAPYDSSQSEQLLERMYNMGGWGGTTGAKDVYSYQQSKRLEDDMLRIQAQQAGATEQDRLFDRYFKATSAMEQMAANPYDLITMGGNLGGTASNAAVNAAQYPWLAAQTAAGASASFWGSIGSTASNAASSIVAAYQNSKQPQRPLYEPSPNFSGGNSSYRWG
jgi:hypothetical protein